MSLIFNQLLSDEAGFIVSAELVLVATVLILGLLVGLSELALNITSELESVGSAFGHLNQGYVIEGLTGHVGEKVGHIFEDIPSFCSDQGDIVCDLLNP
ncbi:branched-chain amino acid aminotransferase [Thalassoglobus polymorphus]|uniref:Branched-chain amino acid aminotransferase n=1 Tax=Thalassoglobus polymorphus TaxID=2527994 RepID=A0A517QRD8_9PLAN|nr:branched-chain amino acid aminotransferase [Thalassoglobus polymorphus]QDT34165.1 hypothetical protein Mal48_34250 [Thalassoglobus polymorphus]